MRNLATEFIGIFNKTEKNLKDYLKIKILLI